MTKMKMKLILWGLVMCLAIGVPVSVNATSLSGVTSSTIQSMRDQISDAQKEREKLQSSLSDVKSMVAQLQKEKSNLNNYVAKLDKNLEEIEAKIADLNEQIVVKEAEIVETQKMLDEALEKESSQQVSMGNHIRLIYQQGIRHYFEVLLQAESLGDLLNRITYVNSLAQYDKTMLDNFIETREYVELCKEQLDLDKAILDETKAGVESEQQALETLIEEKAAEIKKYENNINTQKQAIDEYEAELAEQTELIAQIEAAIIEEQKRILEENGVVLEYDGGAFVFPLASYTRVSSDYGWRIHPTLKVEKFHNGVDFAAPKGTAIYASYDGVVAASAYSSTMGNYVMINHGGGLYTIYMHASKLCVEKDEIVVRGEKIAEVGSTGRSTGNHLHYTVRKNGEYISPWKYISKK